MEKKLLVYGFDRDKDRYKAIKEEADNFGIKISDIDDSMLNEKVGYLMGLEGYEKSPEKSTGTKDIEFLLFSDFDREELSGFLISLRKKNVTVPHKSVITDTTKDWTFSELLNHIEVEHRVMEKFTVLGTFVKKARAKLMEERNAELEHAVDAAMELTKMQEVTEQDVDDRFKLFMKCGLDDFRINSGKDEN